MRKSNLFYALLVDISMASNEIYLTSMEKQFLQFKELEIYGAPQKMRYLDRFTLFLAYGTKFSPTVKSSS